MSTPTSSTTDGMDPEEIDDQPFNVNGPIGSDEKRSESAVESEGMDPTELDDQPFDVNGPAGTDKQVGP